MARTRWGDPTQASRVIVIRHVKAGAHLASRLRLRQRLGIEANWTQSFGTLNPRVNGRLRNVVVVSVVVIVVVIVVAIVVVVVAAHSLDQINLKLNGQKSK